MYGAGQFLGNFVTFEALGRMSADDFALAEARTDRLMSRIGYWNLPRLSQYPLKSAVKEYEKSIEYVTRRRQTAPRTGRTVAEEAADGLGSTATAMLLPEETVLPSPKKQKTTEENDGGAHADDSAGEEDAHAAWKENTAGAGDE